MTTNITVQVEAEVIFCTMKWQFKKLIEVDYTEAVFWEVNNSILLVPWRIANFVANVKLLSSNFDQSVFNE